MIFTDDHEPAHIHAIGAGGEAKIELGATSGQVRLIWAAGLSNAQIRRAVTEVERERSRFMETWTHIHGAAES